MLYKCLLLTVNIIKEYMTCTNIMEHPCRQYECNKNKCLSHTKIVNSLMLESVGHQDQYMHI